MRRVAPLALLLLVSALAVLIPTADPVVKGGPIVAGDLAWMMTAAGLVLLMTIIAIRLWSIVEMTFFVLTMPA